MEAVELREALDQLKGTLDKKVEGLKDEVDTQAEEMRKFGGTATTTAEKIEQFETEIRANIDSLKEGYEELLTVKGTVDAIEKFVGRKGKLGGSDMDEQEMRTVGRTFAESDQLKSMVDQGANSTNRVNYKSIFPDRREMRAGTLTNLDTGWGGMGSLILPFELGEVIEDPRRTFLIRDLMRVIPVQSDAVHFAEVSGFANIYKEVVTQAAASQAAVILDNVDGLFVGQQMMFGTQSRIIAAGGINASTNTVTVTANFSAILPIGTPVTSDQMAMIPHGGRKPQASLKYADQTLSISTLAHWMAVHRQTLSDAPQLQSIIDSELRYGLALAEEDQLLWGNGVSPNLTGLMVNANLQNHGGIPSGDQRIDHLRRAITKTEIAQFPPNGILMHPQDWEAVELLKDNQQRYLWFNIQQPNQRSLFAIPVVVTTAMPAGQFLVGAFGLGAYLFDREQANVRISESHGTFFTENMVAVLAEERIGLGVVRPEAFVKGVFTPA